MPRKDASNEFYYDAGVAHHEVKKPHLFKKVMRAFKSCFGHGFDNNDTPSRRHYIRSQDTATGFEGEEIHGLQAEYLDEDDMAWGGTREKSSRRRKRNVY